jgi:hypothetical protein
MKSIPLTQGKFALVDDEDYEWLNQWKWRAVRNKVGYWYAKKNSQDGTPDLMHRLIMNAPASVEVDHRDNHGLHNWRGNLRLCTHSQNMHNRQLNRNSRTGYKGVSYKKSSRKYQAIIKSNSHTYFLGYYDNAIDAAHAYDRKARELHGPFAKTNFQN